MNLNKNTFGFLVLLFSLSAHAQITAGEVNTTCFDNVVRQQEKLGLEALQKLKVYGNTTIGGKYRKCDEVVNIRNNVKDKVWQEYTTKCDSKNMEYFTATHTMKFSTTMFLDSVKAHSEFIPDIERGSKYIPDPMLGCFGGKTEITIGQLESDKYEFANFENYYDNFDKDAPGYVLSSTIAEISDASADYQEPCWAKVEAAHRVDFYNGANVCTITYKPEGQTAFSCVTTPRHAFRVQVCEPNGQKSCTWKVVSEIDPETMKLISDSNMPVEILSKTTSTVQDGWGWPSWADFDFVVDFYVYNLSVETGTFYIGDSKHRVLVHNFSS
jgi:hypothetical protein